MTITEREDGSSHVLVATCAGLKLSIPATAITAVEADIINGEHVTLVHTGTGCVAIPGRWEKDLTALIKPAPVFTLECPADVAATVPPEFHDRVQYRGKGWASTEPCLYGHVWPARSGWAWEDHSELEATEGDPTCHYFELTPKHEVIEVDVRVSITVPTGTVLTDEQVRRRLNKADLLWYEVDRELTMDRSEHE